LNQDPSVVEKRRKKPTHGMTNSPTYGSWVAMKQRCLSKKHPAYETYKHIKICDEWLHSFENFLTDMGERPEGKTLDRIDGNGGYNKENCRWATSKEQCNNTKSNKRVVYKEKSYTITQLSEAVGIRYATIRG
jgi:hypothetical protein